MKTPATAQQIAEALNKRGINTAGSQFADALINTILDSIDTVQVMGRDYFLKNTSLGPTSLAIVLEFSNK